MLRRFCRLRHFNKLKNFVEFNILLHLECFVDRHSLYLENFIQLDILLLLEDFVYPHVLLHCKAGYSLDIMRQTACLVFNPIMVEGYAALFSCTAVVQALDSMTASM